MVSETPGAPASQRPAGELVDPRTERTRRVVRQAVVDELAQVGYGALTIEAVAARAGVAKSTIYRHWRDKVSLIADAFESAHIEIVPSLEGSTARGRVERLVRHVAEVLVEPTFARCMPALVEGAARDPRLRDFHYRYNDQRRQSLVGAVKEGTSQGDFAAGTDAELATAALLGALFYRLLMTAEPLEPARADALVDAVLGPRRPRRNRSASRASYRLSPIGRVESSLVKIADAPRQGDEGAPPAWLVFFDQVAGALANVHEGDELIVLTWLDRAQRDVLVTYPEDDEARGLHGVFSTRSSDRPNPIGLHRVNVQARDGVRVLVYPLEAVDGTPLLDVKPVLDAVTEK
ncbi:MAG TPA: TrmO family methyltransferase [Acidimicrobiales bacterium]|nr:TrmO family methyltransferase [Acidimicrobiales bacterium]